MTYGTSTTTDTQPLAAVFAADNAHMDKVRYQYELTKARHLRGNVTDRAEDRVPKAVVVKVKGHCVNGHKMTAENTYTYVPPDGRQRLRCRECTRVNNRRARAKAAADV